MANNNLNSYSAEDTGGAWPVIKLILLGLAGGVAGALLYIVLLCALDISSVITMILCGAGVTAFYLAFGHGSLKGAKPHVIIVADTLLACIIANFLTVLIHYAPKIEIPERPMNLLQKAFYFYNYAFSHTDQITSEGFVVHDDALSLVTVLIASALFALVGAYATMLAVYLYDRKQSKKAK